MSKMIDLDVEAAVQAGSREDVFSIHNGSQGVAFTSAFTWTVLRKLIGRANGECTISKAGHGVSIEIVVPGTK